MRWQNFFGDVWELYVHRLPAQSLPDDRLVPETRLKESWPAGRKSCDNQARAGTVAHHLDSRCHDELRELDGGNRAPRSGMART